VAKHVPAPAPEFRDSRADQLGGCQNHGSHLLILKFASQLPQGRISRTVYFISFFYPSASQPACVADSQRLVVLTKRFLTSSLGISG
jgi:hypothetical protein